MIYRLNQWSVIDVVGADAAAIVHNLTTNEVKKLSVGEGRETFITDVRGKTLGHGFLYRHEDRFRLIGSPGQSDRIASHVDKYTIREDAAAVICDDQFAIWVVNGTLNEPSKEALFPSEPVGPITTWAATLGGTSVEMYATRILGEGTWLVLAPVAASEVVEASLCSILGTNSEVLGETEFHQARVASGFPWYGVDLTDANLPQEADRDAVAVSFTKGCYLGQETVARLDALGQVQKKLVRWQIAGAIPPPDTTVDHDGKTVGRLTSVSPLDGTHESAMAIGFARRSHFATGATAAGIDPATEKPFTATVMGQ